MPFVLFAAYLAFAARRLLRYLHIFQQEEYDGARFLRWLIRDRAVDRRGSAAILVAGVAALAFGGAIAAYLAPGAAALALVAIAALEPNPLKSAKKRLVLTARAKRILAAAAVLLVALAGLLALSGAPLLLWLVAVQAVPPALVAGNALLAPYEKAVQQRFWSEAHDKLARIGPTVVGITGSFGKTSVKHILGHALATQAATLVTPGSVNTPMGIARIVRERLTPQHRFFLCEMGAYGPGSIARLCRLAPPNIGIISAIGHAHYERFRSLDAVARAKFELAEAVLANSGRMIVAEQVLEVAYARDFVARHRASFTLVGKSPEADLRLASARQTAAGIEVELGRNGELVRLKAPLFGEHHGMNLALAFALAEAIGVAREDIVLSLASTPQVEHRLEVKRQADGSTIIDDAYNSNPVGFANGLKLLDLLRADGGRRILVTPGMVELGAAHDAEHRKIGELAGRHVDVLLPVAPQRIEALVAAYQAARQDGIVVPCSAFAEAQAWMSANLRFGDVVLLENDLPDLYEARPTF